MTVPPEKAQEAQDLWRLVQEKRTAARTLLEAGLHGDSLSRSYYSAFHAVTLLFLMKDETFSSHRQLLGQFNKVFVHAGDFSSNIARNLGVLFDARQAGDYDHHITFGLDDAQDGLARLDAVLVAVREFVRSHWGLDLELSEDES